jgi:predicted ATPase/DNA-binding SARP family transcriptional activator/Tfp pilus assembly protein PilF
MTDHRIRLEFLGRLSLWQGSRELRRFRTHKTALLLAYLAFYKQRIHPREYLVELFWPDSAPEAARSNLSVALTALRGQLEGPDVPRGSIVVADRSQVHLNPAAFTTDVEEFNDLANRAKGEPDSEKRSDLLNEALRLYQGDLLPGFHDEWVQMERDQLERHYLSTLRELMKLSVELRRLELGIECAHRMVQADPLQESNCLSLMRLYVAVGRPENALSQYRALEALLREQVHAAPSAALRDLAAKLESSEVLPAPTRGARVAESPELEQNLPVTASAPRRLGPSSAIPQQFTRFFGRTGELEQLTEMLLGGTRLITLTGPGGTGKTRLAIEVAQSLKQRFPGGSWFASLANAWEAKRLPEMIRDTLLLPSQITAPVLDQIVEHVNATSGPTLLVLDNFEQITADGAPVVWTLLNRAPELLVLVTSRQPLSLPGEREFPVLALPTPADELRAASDAQTTAHLMSFPAIALFVDRAQAVRPEFQITVGNARSIVSLCQQLEGLPLAIELSAARARALAPSQMLERLTERFTLLASRRLITSERHRSLWAAIDWSYELLPRDLQRLFARLSVFRGGCSLEAAEAVCDERLALDYIAQLRGHSLLFAEECSSELRFRMLETIREFAAEKLRDSDETDEVKLRHLRWFTDVAEEAEKKLAGPDQQTWIHRLETDHDNLRAALQFAVTAAARDNAAPGAGPPDDTALRLSSSLCRFWESQGHITEGRELLARALGAAETDRCPTAAAKALNGAGMLALRQGDYDEARINFQNALAINVKTNNRVRVALNLNNLGIVANATTDYAAANACYREALAISREIGSRAAEALNLGNLGILAFEQSDFANAGELYAEALAIHRELGDQSGEARTLYNIGNMHAALSNHEQARALFEEALMIDRALGSRYGMVHRLGGLASVAASVGQSERAVRLYGAGEALREEIGTPIPAHEQAIYEENIAALREAVKDNPRFDALWQEGRDSPLERVIDYALSQQTTSDGTDWEASPSA